MNILIYILISLITVSGALVTISRIPRKKKFSLKKGMSKSTNGLTIHLKNEPEYILSIICQKGTEGNNTTFDVQKDTISYEYLYKSKNKILTANIIKGEVAILIE